MTAVANNNYDILADVFQNITLPPVKAEMENQRPQPSAPPREPTPAPRNRTDSAATSGTNTLTRREADANSAVRQIIHEAHHEELLVRQREFRASSIREDPTDDGFERILEREHAELERDRANSGVGTGLQKNRANSGFGNGALKSRSGSAATKSGSVLVNGGFQTEPARATIVEVVQNGETVLQLAPAAVEPDADDRQPTESSVSIQQSHPVLASQIHSAVEQRNSEDSFQNLSTVSIAGSDVVTNNTVTSQEAAHPTPHDDSAPNTERTFTKDPEFDEIPSPIEVTSSEATQSSADTPIVQETPEADVFQSPPIIADAEWAPSVVADLPKIEGRHASIALHRSAEMDSLVGEPEEPEEDVNDGFGHGLETHQEIRDTGFGNGLEISEESHQVVLGDGLERAETPLAEPREGFGNGLSRSDTPRAEPPQRHSTLDPIYSEVPHEPANIDLNEVFGAVGLHHHHTHDDLHHSSSLPPAVSPHRQPEDNQSVASSSVASRLPRRRDGHDQLLAELRQRQQSFDADTLTTAQTSEFANEYELNDGNSDHTVSIAATPSASNTIDSTTVFTVANTKFLFDTKEPARIIHGKHPDAFQRELGQRVFNADKRVAPEPPSLPPQPTFQNGYTVETEPHAPPRVIRVEPERQGNESVSTISTLPPRPPTEAEKLQQIRVDVGGEVPIGELRRVFESPPLMSEKPPVPTGPRSPSSPVPQYAQFLGRHQRSTSSAPATPAHSTLGNGFGNGAVSPTPTPITRSRPAVSPVRLPERLPSPLLERYSSPPIVGSPMRAAPPAQIRLYEDLDDEEEVEVDGVGAVVARYGSIERRRRFFGASAAENAETHWKSIVPGQRAAPTDTAAKHIRADSIPSAPRSIRADSTERKSTHGDSIISERKALRSDSITLVQKDLRKAMDELAEIPTPKPHRSSIRVDEMEMPHHHHRVSFIEGHETIRRTESAPVPTKNIAAALQLNVGVASDRVVLGDAWTRGNGNASPGSLAALHRSILAGNEAIYRRRAVSPSPLSPDSDSTHSPTSPAPHRQRKPKTLAHFYDKWGSPLASPTTGTPTQI